MYQRLDALKARVLVVCMLFLASACVIQGANEQDEGAVKAEPVEAEAAVAKAPAVPGAKPVVVAKTAKTPVTGTKTAAAPAAKTAAAPVAKTPAPAAKTVPKTEAATAKTPVKAEKTLAATVKLNRVSRYVGVENLNVRSRADEHAPIVGRLARGSMITVSVDGNWAKIGDQQYVAVKHLSKSQPMTKRLVSRK